MFRAVLLLLILVAPGCGLGSSSDPKDPLSQMEPELAALIEQGLEDQLPLRLSEHEQAFFELALDRRQVAQTMIDETRDATAPLVVAATLFAIDGPVDLLLVVVPVHKLGKALGIARKALRSRRTRGKTDELVGLMEEFIGQLDLKGQDFLRMAEKLAKRDIKALKTIHDRVGSEAVIRALMRKRLDRKVDLRWVEKMLEKGKVDGDFARRFTFDADLVEEFTTYSANPSWATLKRVVEGSRVDRKARVALMRKLKGLLGERAAARRVRSKAFRDRWLDGSKPASVARGVGYRGGGSLDLVVTNEAGEIVAIEVKNWSKGTWESQSSRQRLLEQLERHDEGIKDVDSELYGKELKGKVLMVAERGYKEGMSKRQREDFEDILKSSGWKVERIPNKNIKSTASFIDDLR